MSERGEIGSLRDAAAERPPSSVGYVRLTCPAPDGTSQLNAGVFPRDGTTIALACVATPADPRGTRASPAVSFTAGSITRNPLRPSWVGVIDSETRMPGARAEEFA